MLGIQSFNPYLSKNIGINFEGKIDKLLNKIKNHKGKIGSLSLSLKKATSVLEKAGYEVIPAQGSHFNIKKDGKFLFQIATSHPGADLLPGYKNKIVKLLRDNSVVRYK